jgi:hypothetical protein
MTTGVGSLQELATREETHARVQASITHRAVPAESTSCSPPALPHDPGGCRPPQRPAYIAAQAEKAERVTRPSGRRPRLRNRGLLGIDVAVRLRRRCLFDPEGHGRLSRSRSIRSRVVLTSSCRSRTRSSVVSPSRSSGSLRLAKPVTLSRRFPLPIYGRGSRKSKAACRCCRQLYFFPIPPRRAF